MPNWTVNDYWTRYLGSEGNASEPTPARNADAGTYLQSLGLDAPVTYVPWKADKLTMKTIDGTQKEIELVKAPTTEELLKHTHNPRGLKKPTTPALEFFAKNLPPVGSKIYFQLIEGQSSPAKVEENDERTVYITTPYGLQGYLCPCSFCSSSWQAVVTTSRQRDWDGWYGDHELARQEMRWAENRYQKQYLGHIGAIKRAINLGLLTKDGKRALGNEVQKLIETGPEFGRGHVIGIGLELRDPPGPIRRIGLRLTPATQRREMPVGDALRGQGTR